MRAISMTALLVLVVSTGGCARVFHKRPPVGPPPSGSTEEAESTDHYLKKIDQNDFRLKKLDQEIANKRTAGYNTSEAERALTVMAEAIEVCRTLTFERKFIEIEEKLQEIEQQIEMIRSETKRAPKFGDQPIKKEKVERKYLDERDWIRELRGEPDSKSYRFSTTVYLNIPDATSLLQRSRCWDSRMSQFVLQNPPTMESWYYQKDQKMYIFSEDNPVLDQFLVRNELPAQQRDALLLQLCERQVNFGGLKLIYVGPPVADLSSIMEQVFTGRMRMAGMFGMEGMGRRAQATAALPDLTIASIAFNTEFYGLNKLQHGQFQKFYGLLVEKDPDVLASIISLKNKEEFDKVYESAKKAGRLSVFLEEIRLVREDHEAESVQKKKLEELINAQGKEFKRRSAAVVKIYKWQQNLNPNEADIIELVALYPQTAGEMSEICLLFKDTLKRLNQEFSKLRKDLLKFRTQWPELSFNQNAYISIFFLLEGVRFNDKLLADGSTIEEPDLALKVVVKMMRGKKDPPLFVKETDLKVSTANRYIDEVKEYRRLASFGIVFPFKLEPGRYEVVLTVVDNLRVKTVKQELVWQIVSSEKK